MQVWAGRNGGSGTLVAVNSSGVGIVVTAAHVIENYRIATAIFQSGYRASGAVLAIDPPNDVAAFMITAPRYARPIPVAAENPDIGSTLEYIGFRYRTWLSTTSGYHRYVGSDYSLAGVPSRARSGDSGGGVLHEGQLVGVVTGWIGHREHDTGPSLRPIRTLLSGCAPWALRGPPPRPQQPPRADPPPIAAKPQKPPSDELVGLRREIEELRETIEAMRPGDDGKAGPAGQRGPKGERGPGGLAGPPGQGVKIDILAAQIVAILDARQVVDVTKPKEPRKMEYVDTIRVKGLVPVK